MLGEILKLFVTLIYVATVLFTYLFMWINCIMDIEVCDDTAEHWGWIILNLLLFLGGAVYLFAR